MLRELLKDMAIGFAVGFCLIGPLTLWWLFL